MNTLSNFILISLIKNFLFLNEIIIFISQEDLLLNLFY